MHNMIIPGSVNPLACEPGSYQPSTYCSVDLCTTWSFQGQWTPWPVSLGPTSPAPIVLLIYAQHDFSRVSEPPGLWAWVLPAQHLLFCWSVHNMIVPGSVNPLACEPGSYQPNTTQAECLSCPRKFYCPDYGLVDVLPSCLKGHYCPGGNSEHWSWKLKDFCIACC